MSREARRDFRARVLSCWPMRSVWDSRRWRMEVRAPPTTAGGQGSGEDESGGVGTDHVD